MLACSSRSIVQATSTRGSSLLCTALPSTRPRGVFTAVDASPYTPPPSLLDIRDAVEACSPTHNAAERQQCFLNFGLDAHAVDTYYEPVMRMEEAMAERPSEEDLLAQRMVRVAGFFLVLMVGCKVV